MQPAVLNLAGLSWPARLVLSEILDLYKVNGQVWANDQHFVNRLPGISLRTVQGAIKELVDAGTLVRETNQRAQHKRILTPVDLPQNLHEATADSAVAATDLPQNLNETPAKSAVDLPQNLHEATADSADINYTLNTKGKEQENTAASADVQAAISPKKSAASKKSILSEAGPDFQEFWDAYGKKEDTKKCKLRWQALTSEQRQAALAATPAYVAAKPDKKYRKNPLTWLNGECWQDELPDRSPSGAPTPPPARPAGASNSTTVALNHDFEAELQARERAESEERIQKFRAAHATAA